MMDTESRWLFEPRATVPLVIILLTGAIALAGQSPSTGSGPSACKVETTKYEGWQAVQMANAWVKAIIVPQLGGRLMQVTFGGYDYLWVNPQLKGQYYPPEVSAAQKRWFNYGGDKIWPMPEGSESEQQWAGAVGAVLDSGAFSHQVVSEGSTCMVRLIGPPDPQIGQQYTREISMGADSPEIVFRALMKNVSGYPQRWSEQSVSQYNTGDRKDPTQYNREIWAFTPVHPNSVFLNAYHVRTGPGSNPTYSVRDGLFALHYMNVGGEVWVDSPSGWLAVVDGSTKYAMLERYQYDRAADYPGKSTVIFYATGQPTASRQGPAPAPQAPAASPRQSFYMEAEINSPMVGLAPGESYAMETRWYPTRMGSNLKTATYAGMVGQPLTASTTASGLVLAGEFGVFFPGQLVARFYDGQGLGLGTAPVGSVIPLQLVTLQATTQAPADTARVSLHLVDRSGVDRGPLGEAFVNPAAIAP